LPKARKDFFAAIDYLSGFYPSTPRNFISAYAKAEQRIADNPYGYSVYPGLTLRRAFAGKYLVFYDVVEETHTVRIHRILRASWNITDILHAHEPQKEELMK